LIEKRERDWGKKILLFFLLLLCVLHGGLWEYLEREFVTLSLGMGEGNEENVGVRE